MKVELVRRFFFEAAHRNPEGGARQQRVHGHSYRAELVVSGDVTSEYGWLIDYGDIKAAFLPLYRQLDHHYLNEDTPGLEDTRLPSVRAWILDRLKPQLPLLEDVRVSIVGDLAFKPVLLEADPDRKLPARWRFTFEAAQSLPQLPASHPCNKLHGHSYRVEAASADLGALRGALEEVYGVLDHTCLNEVPGLEGTTCEHMCEWLWNRLAAAGRTPQAVMVQETESARCYYYGS